MRILHLIIIIILVKIKESDELYELFIKCLCIINPLMKLLIKLN
jgi:hypothetical protein